MNNKIRTTITILVLFAIGVVFFRGGGRSVLPKKMFRQSKTSARSEVQAVPQILERILRQ